MSAGADFELPAPIAGDLARRARAALGLDVTGWQVLAGGTNNRLYRVETAQGRPLLAKRYHRDRWNRQEREVRTLTLLCERGIAGVPAALFDSAALGYAVFSFEPGTKPDPAKLAPQQMRNLAAFAVELQRIAPAGDAASLPAAISATFSIVQHVHRIEERLDAFERAAAGTGAPSAVRELGARLALRERLAPLIARALAGIAPAELEHELPLAARRLSSGDFGAHNLLIDTEGAITMLDWEWSGWDDPAQLVMGFIAHAGSEGLSDEAADAFLGAYAAQARLQVAEITRFERIAALLEIEWAATYAGALAPEALAARRFAVADFDEHNFAADVEEKLRRRLARVSGGRRQRFPRDG